MSDLEKRIRTMMETHEPGALYDLASIHYELMMLEEAHASEVATLRAELAEAWKAAEARRVQAMQAEAARDNAERERDEARAAIAEMTARCEAAEAEAERARKFYRNGSCAEDCSRICHHLGCTAGVVRCDDGSRVCVAGHVGRWVDRAELDAMTARCEARPDISREDARHFYRRNEIAAFAEIDERLAAVSRVYRALRKHAGEEG